MKSKDIKALIKSEPNQSALTKKLFESLKENPELIASQYELDRSIFHLLVIHKKPEVLSALLESSELNRELVLKWAQEPDKAGKTILHHAASNRKYLKSLRVIIKRLPILTNRIDAQGNTALHIAVKHKEASAIRLLISLNNIDASIKNKDGKTAQDLANNDPSLILALNPIDLSRIESLKTVKSKTKLSRSLKTRLPGLSSSSSSSLSSTRSYTSDTSSSRSSTLSSATSAMEVNWSFSLNASEAWQFLSDCKTSNEDESAYKLFMQQFIHHCTIQDLSEEKEELEKKIFSSPNNIYLLRDILLNLYSCILEQEKHLSEKINELTQAFEESFPPLQAENEENNDSRAENLSEYLHELVSWQVTDTEEYEIKRKTFLQQIRGLQGFNSSVKIVSVLRQMFDSFSPQQKNNANFIIWYLLTTNIENFSQFAYQLSLFKNFQMPKINDKFQELQDLVNAHNNSILLKNYLFIKTLNDAPFFQEKKYSFDRLVNTALQKKSTERQEELTVLSQELKNLSILFYQHVKLGEFIGENWRKENKNEVSPTIVRQTEYFNRLQDYFVCKILHLPHDSLANAIRFLIQLADNVCPANNQAQYPDQNTLMLITSVLNDARIARLSTHLNKLTETEQQQLEALNERVNRKNMREMLNESRTTLAFLGLIQSDFTFAGENQDYSSRSEVLSKPVECILSVKQNTKEFLVFSNSDLPEFIASYTMSDDTVLLAKSYKIQPKKFDITNISLELFIETMESEYFPCGILPCFTQGNKPLKLKAVISCLLAVFSKEIVKDVYHQRFFNTVLEILKINAAYNKESIEIVNIINQILKTLQKVFEKKAENHTLSYRFYRSIRNDLLYMIENIQLITEKTISPVYILYNLRESYNKQVSKQEITGDKKRRSSGNLFFSPNSSLKCTVNNAFPTSADGLTGGNNRS